jgi:hypothetical protein
MLHLETHAERCAALGELAVDLRVIHDHCKPRTRYQVWAERSLAALRTSGDGRVFVKQDGKMGRTARKDYFVTLPLAEMIYAREVMRIKMHDSHRMEIKFTTLLVSCLEGLGSVLPGEVILQHKIGNYVVDAFVARCALCVEYDERYHERPGQREKDREREEEIRRLVPGVTIIRVKEGMEGERLASIVKFLEGR